MPGAFLFSVHLQADFDTEFQNMIVLISNLYARFCFHVV
jgi:hypothetical protein